MTTRDEREEKKKRKLEEDANRNDADSKRLREPPVTGQAEGGDLQRGRVGASKSEQVTDEKTGSAGKDRQPAGLHGHYPQFDRVAIEKAKEELLAAVIEVREKALARENNVGHTDAFTLEAERTEDDAEKLLALPLRIERVEPMAVDASAAGLQRAPSTASRLQSPGILEQSSLMPQCAMIGAVAHPAEPETSTNQALHMADNGMDLAATSPNKLPTRQYMIAKEQLHCTVLRPDGQQQHLASSSAAGAAAALPPLSWDRFPNYLGEGVRSRLLSLASLHLLDSGRCPSAVKDMPSNSNKVLLGAAPNCELYQERVIRALAGKLGVPLLSVDAATLKLDGDELKEEAAQSSGEDVFEMGRLGMGPPPDPYDSLDDEDPYQFDRRDRDKDYPQPTPRAPGVSGRRSFNFAFLPAPPPPRPTLRPRDPKAGAAPGTAAGAAGAADPPGKPPPQGTDEKVAAHAATKAALGKEGDPQHASLPTSFIGEDWGALQERIATMAAHAVASLTSDMGTFQGATPPPESEQRGGVPGQAVASPLRAPSPHEVAAAEAGAMGRERVAQGAAGAEVETGKRGEASLGKGGRPSDGAGAAGSPRHSGKALAGNRQAQRAQQGGDSAAAAAAAAEIQALPALSAAISVVAGTPPLPPEPTQVQDAPGRTAAVPSAAAAGGTAEQPAGQGGGACDVPTAAPRTAGAAAAQPSLKRNARVAYIGRLHPAVVASQDRLEAIESAISRIEAQGHSNARLQQYLPALLMRQRAALAAAGKASTHSGRMQGPDAPPIGSLGRVRSVSGEKVVVELDEPFSGGSAKPGGKEKVLFTCTAGECQQVDDKEDPWVSSFRALFDVIREESEKGPLIVSIKGLDRLIRSQAADHFRKLEALLAQMPPRCIIFACYCSRTLAREKAGGGGGGGTGGGGVFGARLAMDLLPGMDEMAGFLDRIGRHSLGKGHRKSSKGKLLAKMFPNTIELYAPNQEVHSKQWRKMVETDVSTMRTRSNRAALQKAMVKCGMACDDLAGVVISDCQLSRREVEQLLGLAVAEQLREEPEGSCLSGAQVQQTSAARQGEGEGAVRQEGGPLLDQKTAGEAAEQLHPAQGGVADVAAMEVEVQQPWILKAKHIAAAAQSLRQLQQEMVAQPERKGLKDVSADQYEKQLLSEVIPPEEINVKFDDIGALEAVKTTLHEVVILPLQRPELFTRGSLTKPTKGLLLFGPPGTGKTMLAKAVASESRAHFINVNMSAITSKWFGEGERLVRALFSLAHKLSPAVIFIDEIDSFLSKRGQSNNEHEALRKMKNEFMQHWDGLRTKQSDRVLVLAATNRPMDLDDAVVRRMPRRIFVPLPDAANRAKILQVILQDEAVEEGFSSEEVASWTEGYSGSDLKNLSIAAAYFPIRHFLDEERRRKQAGGGEQGHGQGQAGTAAGGGESTLAGDLEGREPSLRHISMADFKEAMKQVTSSVSDEAVSMSELKRWNDQYGEGGSRRVEKLHYFT